MLNFTVAEAAAKAYWQSTSPREAGCIFEISVRTGCAKRIALHLGRQPLSAYECHSQAAGDGPLATFSAIQPSPRELLFMVRFWHSDASHAA